MISGLLGIINGLKDEADRVMRANLQSNGSLPPATVQRTVALFAAAHALQHLATLDLTEGTPASEGVTWETGKFAIDVEKLLCEALGRPWTVTGISIVSLVAEIRSRLSAPELIERIIDRIENDGPEVRREQGHTEVGEWDEVSLVKMIRAEASKGARA